MIFKIWLETNATELKKLKIIGIGGNINKIYKISGVKYTKPLTLKNLKILWINSKKCPSKLIKLKLNPDRIDVIHPAGRIYYFLLKTLSIKEIEMFLDYLNDGMVSEII